MEPVVSIITINYNNAKGLEATLQSVINQTYPKVEFIVIDGGSNDGSKAILDTYKDHIDVLVCEPDTGIFNAMNKGIAKASGDYLQFLNSGDYFNDAASLNDFVTHNSFKGDIIYGDYTFHNGHKTYPDTLTPAYFMLSSLPHQSTLFAKSVFELMGTYDESFKIIADRAFFLNCFLSDRFTFTHIAYALVYFDLEGVSNHPQTANDKLIEDERLFREAYGLYYPDVKRLWELNKELATAKRNTAEGILKRIKQRLSKRK
ncbi:MAG: glycosyltransferase family 2 protein [Gilvibacter sp.]